MESQINKVNVNNQNKNLMKNNFLSESIYLSKKPKINYWIILAFVLIIALIILFFWFFIENKKNINFNQNKMSNFRYIPTAIPTQIKFINTQVENNPKLAVFMREGLIYVKNFNSNQEKKISQTTRVGSPNLSPNGKYIVYFSINHNTGGFPRSDVFISDISGSFEKKLGNTNEFASKISWSKDGNYLGLILFSDKNPFDSDFYAEALLYDLSSQKDIIRSRIDLGQDLSNNQYNVNFDCDKLDAKYISFCNEFVLIAKTKQLTSELNYKADQYKNSIYTKTGYKLNKSYKITDDLVVLEYYTGKPRNPESQWVIGGGVFIPGYDEGVEKTYTILLNEKTNEVITEILNAVDTKFLF